MATTVTTETLFEGPTIIVKQVSVDAASDETATEQSVIDKSTLAGPGTGGGNVGTLANMPETGDLSLLEATWSMSSVWEGAKLYWHDETNDSLILEMIGDSAISFRGIGGKNYGAETEAGDGDVLLDLTNAEEAAGAANFVFVFKKKP